jgi:hypothetical protein
MSRVCAELSASLDGFIAGPNVSVENGGGPEHMQLECTRAVGAAGGTHLRFRIAK